MASSERSAVVSGASSGIGLEIARALSQADFRVIMLGRDRARLDRAAGDVPRASAVRCDVGDDATVAGAVGEIRKQLGGAPSLLVNNAGEFRLASIEKESVEHFARTLDVSVTGPISDTTGYVVDLGALKQIVEKAVVDRVDHKNFNLDVEFMRGVIPTAENIVVAFWKALEPAVKPGKLSKLVLWETDNNYVEYRGE